jgi:hypothetical protein
MKSPSGVMDAQTLETNLEAVLRNARPTLRDVRDALVDYFAAVATPFIEKGLAHTHPDADPALVRRLLVARLSTLWNDLGAPWDAPTVEALARFRERIDRYACVRDELPWRRSQRLLDELLLQVAVEERVRALRARAPVRRLKVIEGGGEVTEPRGQLRLVREGESESAASG